MNLDKSPISEFDFSQINPTEESFVALLNRLENTSGIIDASYWLAGAELIITAEMTAEKKAEVVTDVLPTDAEIKDVTVTESGNPLEVEFFISLKPWFGYDSDKVDEGDTKETYSEEAIAFSAASLQFVSEIETTEIITNEDEGLSLSVTFEEPVETSRLVEEVQDFVGLFISKVDFVSEGIMRLVLSWSQSTFHSFTISDADAFRMTQIRHHEDIALEKYRTTLPCEHQSSIEFLGICLPDDTEINEYDDVVTIDGFDCRCLPMIDDDASFPAISKTPTGEDVDIRTEDDKFIKLDFSAGFYCEECHKYYAFIDENEVRETLLEFPRPKRMSISISNTKSYTFAIPPVSPKPSDLLEQTDIKRK